MNSTSLAFVSSVIAGVTLVAISGLMLMYRQVGELKVELKHLSEAIKSMTDSAKEERMLAREEMRALHGRIDMLRQNNHDDSIRHATRFDREEDAT